MSPILCYSSEIWCLCDAEVIECVHWCYIKQILSVKHTTTSNAIYRETGCFPLLINRKIRVVKYWLKLNPLKPTFKISQYLFTVSNVKLRQYIKAIRLSSHNLLIEYWRHRNIPRNERHCNKCTNNNGSLGNEYHFCDRL